MSKNIPADDFKANIELNRVRNTSVLLVVILQLFSMRFPEESCAGYYKKIRYKTNLLLCHTYSEISCVRALWGVKKGFFVVKDILIRDLVNLRLEQTTWGLQQPCSAADTKTNYLRADPF